MIRFLLEPFERSGRAVVDAVLDAGHACVLLADVLTWGLFAGVGRARLVFAQLYVCGAESLFVSLVVGAFSGMIIGLQTGLTLKGYSLEGVLGSVVLYTMLKELGPFMCAFIVAGRVGSAMAAELGTMKVSEEIDALEVMSISPTSYLVVPRVLALALVCPMLTIYVNVVGVIGGALVAKYQIGVSFVMYYDRVWDDLANADLVILYGGLVKAVVFGLVIAAISCSNGLRATRGAAGVGEASRKSVVQAFLLILVLNYFMSSIIHRYFE